MSRRAPQKVATRRDIIGLVNATFLPGWTLAGANTGFDPSLRLDHIGIAVRSVAAARSFYEIMGMRVDSVEEIDHEQVRVGMVSLGSSRIELIEPLQADSVVGRFLERRGEGLHHIALQVDNLDAKFRELVAGGTRLANDSIRTGAGGHRYFFVHPASTGGVLIEMVEAVVSSGAVVTESV